MKQAASTALFAACFMPISFLAYYSRLMIEICSSGTPVDFQRATRHYIQKDITFYNFSVMHTNNFSCNVQLWIVVIGLLRCLTHCD
jgi:hypothetical protein